MILLLGLFSSVTPPSINSIKEKKNELVTFTLILPKHLYKTVMVKTID